MLAAGRDVESEAKLSEIHDDHVYRATVPDPRTGKPVTIRTVPRIFGGNRDDLMLADGRMPRGTSRDAARNRAPVVPMVLADYGFCLTIHKSQGSQWPEVLVLLDRAFVNLTRRNAEEARRLVYTACTRASDRLVIGRLG